MHENLTLGVSPITETVYLGRLNKKGNMWLNGKRDVTEMFLKCSAEFFKPGTEHTLSVDGEPYFIITAKNPKKTKAK